ncbi:MAG: hypothetical protein K2M68_09055 [Muribaculaceae bacterium]|nr:hypothetical protein [Bacteroides sp.]MDE7473715.1 hypothetical protein [Muribaculaceae bacterium]
MNVTLEKKDDGTGIITVNIEEKDYAQKVTDNLKHIGRTHTIPGFRKGHVSIDQLRRRFGRDVKSDVINHEVIEAALNYIRENKINCLGEILPVEVKEINLTDADYTFQYEVGIGPKLDIELNKDITIPFYNIEVTDEMINEQDEDLRRRFGKQEQNDEVTADAFVKGTIMELNADGTVKEGENAIQNNNGMLLVNHIAKEEADKFIGKKVGEKVIFNPAKATNGNTNELASLLGISAEAAAGVEGDFEFNIAEIMVIKPAEHNEEFYKMVFQKEIKSEEEYKEELKKFIAAQLAPNSQILFDMTAEKVLVEKYGNMELPANFLKKWLVSRQDGVTEETVDEEYTRMEPAIKWQLIRDVIAEKNELAPTKEDVESYAKNYARRQLMQYGMVDADDEMVDGFAKRFLEDKNFGRQIVEQVAARKLFMCIRSLVNAEEKTISLDEFKTLANAEK